MEPEQHLVIDRLVTAVERGAKPIAGPETARKLNEAITAAGVTFPEIESVSYVPEGVIYSIDVPALYEAMTPLISVKHLEESGG